MKALRIIILSYLPYEILLMSNLQDKNKTGYFKEIALFITRKKIK